MALRARSVGSSSDGSLATATERQPLLRRGPTEEVYEEAHHGYFTQTSRLVVWVTVAMAISLALVALLPYLWSIVWAGTDRGRIINNGTLTPQTPEARVGLGYATYLGTPLEIGVNEYLGMRFAAPPIGDLRWRAPANPTTEQGITPATNSGPKCIGVGSQPSSAESEDCLTLSVWAPKTAGPASKLPVWLFIQGGGYAANSNANHNGSNVIDKSGMNLVFVRFNYRVGAHGFLASEQVKNNGDLNVGLLDQRKVMEWVQRYIHLFGGDPKHVVIHGVSAGAGSTAYHMTAHGGRDDGLFAAAIGESVFVPTAPKVPDREWQFERFAGDLGCLPSYSSEFDTMACLRGLSIQELQTTNVAMPYPNGSGIQLFYWGPTVDGDFIRESLYTSLEAGRFIQVPILFGDDTDEASLFVPNADSPSDISEFMMSQYPKLTAEDTTRINDEYPLMDPLPEHAAYFPSLSAAYGESCFVCPAITILQAYSHMSKHSRVFSYRYNVQDEVLVAAGLGVTHTLEIPAIFGPGFAGGLGSSYESYNAAIVPVIMNYFISFVRSFDPNTFKYTSAPFWGAYSGGKDDSQQRMMLQTNVTAMEDVPEAQLDRCRFWKGLAAELEI